MSRVAKLFARLTARDGRAEADIALHPERVNARHIGGDPDRVAQEGTTTGTAAGGAFVGRVAGEDHFTGETGSERRDPEGLTSRPH